MRAELFYNPLLLLERLGQWATEKRRMRRLKGSVAASLTPGHVDSLELLDLLRDNPPRVIHDIGANVGTWTLLAKTFFPKAEVHAFEPLEAHRGRFMQNTAALEAVHYHAVALGEAQSAGTLQVTSFSDASSLLPLTDEAEKQWHLTTVEEVRVPIMRLDDLVAEGKVSPPDLLKLDVQGYELGVLKGATECLRHARAVLTEVSFREFYKGQCRFEDLTEHLTAQGFRLHALGHGTLLGRPLVQADALYLRDMP